MNKKKDTNAKNQRIQVFARCRPLNSIEKKQCSPSILEVIPEKKEILVKDKNTNREFFFDKVFPADTKQIAVYKAVVAPLIQEVLNGYNCTVFAYGQTGTGKTFTMEGERNDSYCSWEEDPGAGIIPRSLHQLFEELNKEESVEFSVRVSFLELYNEELFDLLSSNDLSRLRLFETVKKGSVLIQGLEEIMVNSKDEVYTILEKGTARRQTAATLLNATSSRSHTVFSVTVHIKENTIEGEELLKTGKLNLVDLAGSENVGRSGAVDKRAREACSINQSLLTLGRVITALIEKQPHVPYRESKLTRLLQDSLGGHTKTSIIATVSPALCNFEETLSTLDYATKAKSITIKPEVNQKMTKRALIKEYTEEIERLRKDLVALRSKEGFYVDSENYNNIMQDIASKTEMIKELSNKIELLEEENSKIEQALSCTKEELDKTCEQLHETNKKFEETASELAKNITTLKKTRKVLSERTLERDEKQFIVNVQSCTEKKLTQQAQMLIEVADKTVDDVGKLHEKIDRKHTVEKTNEEKLKNFHSMYQMQFAKLDELVSKTEQEQVENLQKMKTDLECFETQMKEHQLQTESVLKNLLHHHNCNLSDFLFQYKNSNAKQSQLSEALCLEITDKQNAQLEKQHSFMNENFPDLMNQISRINSEVVSWVFEVHQQLQQKIENQKCILEQRAKEERSLLVTIQESLNLFHSQREELLQNFSKRTSEISATENELQSEISNGKAILENFLTWFNNTMAKQKNSNEVVSKFHEETFASLNHPVIVMKNVDKPLHLLLEKKENDLVVDKIKLDDMTKTINIPKFQMLEKSLSENHQNLSSEVKKFWEENEEINKTILQEMNNKLESHSTLIAENTQSTENNIQKVKSEIDEKFRSDKLMLETQDHKLLEIVSSMSNIRLDSENRLRSSVTNVKGEILKRDIELEKFITEEIIQDVPTGTTPQRKNYVYPRSLAATSPYQQILQRFHSQTTESLAANLPLDSSFDENEEYSPSLNSENPEKFDLNVSATSEDFVDNETDSCASMSDVSVDKENNAQRKKKSRLPKRLPVKSFLKPAMKKPLSSTNS